MHTYTIYNGCLFIAAVQLKRMDVLKTIPQNIIATFNLPLFSLTNPLPFLISKHTHTRARVRARTHTQQIHLDPITFSTASDMTLNKSLAFFIHKIITPNLQGSCDE